MPGSPLDVSVQVGRGEWISRFLLALPPQAQLMKDPLSAPIINAAFQLMQTLMQLKPSQK
jgi:hypothetical protein